MPTNIMNLLQTPCHNDNTYFWRIGELEYVYNNNIINKLLDENDELWIRSVPELIKDSDYQKILEFEKNYSTVYNTYKFFYDWDAKERAFIKWKDNGLNCPEWHYVNSLDDIKYHKCNYDQYILRINNNYGKKFTFYLNPKTDIDSLNKHFIKLTRVKETSVHERSHTSIIFVEFLKDIRGLHRLIRSHVINNKVVLSIDQGLMERDSIIYYNNLDCNSFIVRNRELNITKEMESDLIKSLGCFGLYMGAVDWLLIDNKCYLLEINPYWGMGYESQYNGFPFNFNWYEEIMNQFDSLPENLQIRLDTNRFWDLVYREAFPFLYD